MSETDYERDKKAVDAVIVFYDLNRWGVELNWNVAFYGDPGQLVLNTPEECVAWCAEHGLTYIFWSDYNIRQEKIKREQR